MKPSLGIRRRLIACICLAAAMTLAVVGNTLAASAVDLPASGGGKQRILYMQPANPVAALKPIKVPPSQTLPFDADQVAALLKACDRYSINGSLQDYVVGVREINYGHLTPQQGNWQNRHTVCTALDQRNWTGAPQLGQIA